MAPSRVSALSLGNIEFVLRTGCAIVYSPRLIGILVSHPSAEDVANTKAEYLHTTDQSLLQYHAKIRHRPKLQFFEATFGATVEQITHRVPNLYLECQAIPPRITQGRIWQSSYG